MSQEKNPIAFFPQLIEELKRSEATFRAMFETSAVGIGILSLDRKIIDANPAMCRIFGRTREQFIGLTPAVATLPEDYPKSTEEFQELMDGKREYYWDERRYVRTNGDIFWAHVTMSIVRDASGNPLYMVGMVIDISEQKRVLAELQTSEARFRAMFENAGIGIALVGIDRRPIAVNEGMVRISGRSREELLATSGAFISHPEDINVGKTELEQLVAGDLNSFQVVRRYLRKDNQPYWVRQTISAVRDQNGQIMYVIVMVEDIDQQKRDQETLLESEARFRAMFESSAIGVLILDVNTLTFRTNAAARALLDDPNLDRKLNNIYEFIHVRYREAETELFEQVLDGKRDSYEAERIYQRSGEDLKWAKVTISAVRGANKQLRYIVAMIDDITEQKRTHFELQESEARFRAMFDNVSVGMSLMGLDRRAMAVNQAAERITGYTAEDLLQINPTELTYLPDRQIGLDEFQELITGKRDGLQMEKRYVRKNGDIFWGRVTYSLVRTTAGQPQYLVGSIEDINDQKLAAEKLAAQEAENRRTLEQRVEERTHELMKVNLNLVNEIENRQKAEEALAAKAAEEAITAERTRLARDLHDAVTQTLFSASMIAEVLPDIWDMDEAEARKSTEELRQLTRGALAEMRTLLLELRPAALTQARFPDLIKQLSEAVIGRARLPVHLDMTGDFEMLPEVKVAFYRIVQESLNNIVKYARATQVEILVRQECCNVHLEIKDNGIGFDPTLIKPTSLGMRIMHERADAIHAHLRITSSPAQGTVITLDWNEDEMIPVRKTKTRGKA